MAKAPAVVIIVRHGARLDAADKSWHLSSPTPYDPPLTYGGWVQSRALGLRIASLLHARERELENNVDSPRGSPLTDLGHFPGAQDAARKGNKTKKKKHKVMVHSSPFQRCVQTSVGISAGLSQYHGLPVKTKKASDMRVKKASQLHSASPRLIAVDSPRLESIVEPQHDDADLADGQVQPSSPPPVRITLRIDAFLGEWLSPDYFERITPPPNSTMMVAGAKASLLRKSSRIDAYTPTIPNATGMWGTPAPPSTTPSSDDQRQTSYRRDRSNSQSNVPASSAKSAGGRSSHSPFRAYLDPLPNQEKIGYVPPTPTYAVSTSDPIPRGYFSHAKDACVNVDYHWDSMRDPCHWGDGGTFGEEWSAMHKRFRRGLNSMVEWYGEQAEAKASAEGAQDNNDDDDDSELVLVLVTHGAGCNALIGALTNQPVLIDVGMASLTMAVRRTEASSSNSSSGFNTPATADDPESLGAGRPSVRRNSADLGLATAFDLKIVASSEHLRPGVDPANASLPTPSSPMLTSQKTLDQRRRYNSTSNDSVTSSVTNATASAPIDAGWSLNETSTGGSASTIGPSGMRRGSVATAAPQKMRTYSLAATAQVQSALAEMTVQTSSPTGLWSSPTVEKPLSPLQDFSLDPSNPTESDQHLFRPAQASASHHSSRPSSVVGSGLASQATDFADGATPMSPRSVPVDKHAANEAAEVQKESGNVVSDLPSVGSTVPNSLGRSLSQKGLWGSAPSGVVSRAKGVPKRRWTLQQEN